MISPQRIEFSAFGPPAEVAGCCRYTLESPPAGHVQLRMLFAPINPADLNFLEGTYGTVPQLPAVPGNEGVGRVEALGPGVTGWEPGDLALPWSGGGLWSQRTQVSARDLLKLPSGLDPQQAAMLRVNPLTAFLLLTEFARLEPGDWVAQNAANSAVGLSVIQLARQHGWRTLNLVRRPEAAEICRQHGADAVVVENAPEFRDQARHWLGSAQPKLALNAVGGESALRLADLLGNRGQHVTFGAMSRQKLSMPNRFLIFKELTFAGFWVTRWMKDAPPGRVAEILSQLAEQMRAGWLQLPVEAVYPIQEIAEALRHAQRGERQGKVLMSLDPD